MDELAKYVARRMGDRQSDKEMWVHRLVAYVRRFSELHSGQEGSICGEVLEALKMDYPE